MQRPTSSSRATDDPKHHVIDITPQSQTKQSPRRKTEALTDLSVLARSSFWKRAISRSRSEKWIHAIPVIVLFCVFILWWFSYPVNLEVKDGRMIAVRMMDMPQALNETRIDLTILQALSTPPNASVADQILKLNNETDLTILALATPPNAPVPDRILNLNHEN